MHREVTVELRQVCFIAGWDDVMPYAGDDTVAVRPDGSVILMHGKSEILIGTLTADEHAAIADPIRA